MTHIIAGGGAGAFAAAVTTPMDVAKTLLNTQERSVISQAHRVDSMTDAVRYIKLNHGPRVRQPITRFRNNSFKLSLYSIHQAPLNHILTLT